jgi:hypothetical protein
MLLINRRLVLVVRASALIALGLHFAALINLSTHGAAATNAWAEVAGETRTIPSR